MNGNVLDIPTSSLTIRRIFIGQSHRIGFACFELGRIVCALRLLFELTQTQFVCFFLGIYPKPCCEIHGEDRESNSRL